jgi:hypothetical protein
MEEALIAYLLADSGVAGFVGNRVFPGSLPQKRELPAIVFTRVDGAPLYADDGEVGIEDPRIQIDCYGETYKSAKLTARAVVARLSEFDGTTGGVKFQFVMLDAERDFRESGSNSAEYLYRTNLDFICWNERT